MKTVEMFIFTMHVADAGWVALRVCTVGTRGAKIPQNQKEAKTKRGEKGTRKQNDVANFQAYYCSHFCFYFAFGNSKGWSYSVRNVVALHCGDLTLAPGSKRHPGHGELNPLEFCAQCL